MTREVGGSLTYHAWHLGVRGIELEEEADPLVLVRGSEFNHNKQKEFTDDLGHMGTGTTKMDSYATGATAEPEFTDHLRYCEGWEDVLLLLLGSDDGEGAVRKTTVTTGVYQYDYGVNVSNPQDPYFATLYNDYAKTEDDCWKYEDALLNKFELKGDNSSAPTYTAGFMSNFPKIRQPSIARTFPATTVFPKPSNVKIYMAPLGTYANLSAISSYQFPCYSEFGLSINNNVTNDPCSDDAFGTTTKYLGERDGEFNLTLPWKSTTKDLEYNFITGSSDTSLTEVTDLNDYKTVWIVMENGAIGSTQYNYQTILKIPKIHMTAVDSPQSGNDAKKIELKGTIAETGTSSFMEASVITSLSDLHIDNTASG